MAGDVESSRSTQEFILLSLPPSSSPSLETPAAVPIVAISHLHSTSLASQLRRSSPSSLNSRQRISIRDILSVKPLKVRDWDKALLEYTLAILTDSGSKSKTPLSRRLTEIPCLVLIIMSDVDQIVPAWNVVRLSKVIPNACLEVIKNCGHLPHEERVDEFLSAVEKFLQRVFGGPEQQLLQATI